jgi:hypothetical protein
MASMADYESSDPGSIPSWVHFFLFFCLTLYQKPVIDHCPWPSSQFNKWHAQNKLLSSSLIVIGSSPWFTPPSHQRTIVAARLVIDEIRLLRMNILVKSQPDIPILMIMGGRLTRYGPKYWGTGENQLKMVKNDAAQLQSPQTLKLSLSIHTENHMA